MTGAAHATGLVHGQASSQTFSRAERFWSASSSEQVGRGRRRPIKRGKVKINNFKAISKVHDVKCSSEREREREPLPGTAAA